MSQFNRRMLRDAVDLIEAAEKDDSDNAKAILARSEPAALAWVLAYLAVAAIEVHDSVPVFTAAVLRDLELDAAEERERSEQLMAALMKPKDDNDDRP